ncbi:hypothetical protein DXA02_07700 [Ruminococcus sp. AM54-1NS]|nr:hypothetical protein DXA02_07700 [Ruminococcus sp. AM54-1NS]
MSKMNKLIKESQDNKKTLGYTYGTVKSYDSTNCTAVVSLLEYNGAEKSFLNKSGEILSMGDSVWIYFRGGGINSGYIAIRNGKPVPLGSQNSSVGRFVEYVDSSGSRHISEKFNYYGDSYWYTIALMEQSRLLFILKILLMVIITMLKVKQTIVTTIVMTAITILIFQK